MNTPITHEVGVQEGYRRWAAQYDQEGNALITLEERLVIPLLATIPAHRVLDIGAGTGRYALRLAAQGAHVTALDQSEAMLSVAQRAAAHAGLEITFVQQSLDMALPGESSSFDLVIAALVFCHVAELAQIAHEAYRVLCPGGHIVVTDFHPAVIAAGWRTQFSDPTGTYLLPTADHAREHYLSALRDAGFRIQTVRDALVRDAPADAFPAEVVAADGNKPFCLVILASKEANE